MECYVLKILWLHFAKKCSKCGKKYSWNPDVGKMVCSYCHGLGKPQGSILGKVFGQKGINKYKDLISQCYFAIFCRSAMITYPCEQKVVRNLLFKKLLKSMKEE